MRLGKNIALLSLVLAAATVSAEQFNCKDSDKYIKISTVDEFLKIGKDNNYPENGRYCIVNDLDFDNQRYRGNMIEKFNGHLVGAYKDDAMTQPVIFKNIITNGSLINELSGVIHNIHLKDGSFYGLVIAPFAKKMVDKSVIEHSSITASSAHGVTVAGLVNEMISKKSIIHSSYIDMDLKGSKAASGLVNIFYNGTIRDSYAVGKIRDAFNTKNSGLVGEQYNGLIVNTYTSFKQESISSIFAGLIFSTYDTDSCANSYWDIKNYHGVIDNKCGTDEKAGRTSAQMRQQSTYINWDFKNVWRMGRDGYPDLRSNSRYN